MRKFITIVILAFTVSAYAQIPTNGLVGHWPFNGNANDESVNGNNGTVVGATLTSDRFGHTNSAYSFDGTSSFIIINNSTGLDLTGTDFSITSWFKADSICEPNNPVKSIITKHRAYQGVGWMCGLWDTQYDDDYSKGGVNFQAAPYWSSATYPGAPGTVYVNNWYNYTVTYDNTNGILKYYLNSVLVDSKNLNFSIGAITDDVLIGAVWLDEYGAKRDYFNGILDDIAIWNRVLTEQEISDIYNNNICYVTITVTDTLIINANLTGVNPVTYQNSIKIFPNPTNDEITIDFGGNYSTMNGYTLKIMNSLSQIVYSTPINTQSTIVDLSTWTGNGIYFVHLIDASSNTIDIRKIVLQ